MSAKVEENFTLINHRDQELVEVKTSASHSDFNILKQELITNKLTWNKWEHSDLNKALLLCCKSEEEFNKVTPNTIEKLLNFGVNISTIDEEFYGWEPLHYVATSTNPDKLKVICRHLPDTLINTLTILSENALHVLLQHSKMKQSFSICCQNADNLGMLQMIKKESWDLVKCAKILIDSGIDVNHPNFWNQTPILIAIRMKYHQVVEFLLATKQIDLDSCKDSLTNKTAREILQSKENLRMFPMLEPEIHIVLFQLLKSNKIDLFLKFKGGKIFRFSNSIDGKSKETSSCTLLQYCFRRSLIFWYQHQKRFECEMGDHEISNGHLVEFFCQNEYSKCILHLLKNQVDINFSLKKFEQGRSILEAAIIKGYHPVVALILGQHNYTLNKQTLNAIVESVEILLQQSEINNFNVNQTISLILVKIIDHCDDCDSDILKRIFQKGVRNINKENFLLLLKFPGALCWTFDDQKSLMEKIEPDIIKSHLDDCVEQSTDGIYINCCSFIKDDSFVPLFDIFSKSEVLQEFLNHIIFKILIMRYWEHFHCKHIKYFYLNFIFYVIFYVLIDIYIIAKFNNFFHPILTSLSWIFLFIFIFKELFQIITNFKLYFQEASNYVEFTFIISTWIVLCFNFIQVDIFEVISILSGNVVLLLLLLNVPDLSRYIIILQTIFFYLRYLLFYFIQFIAFAICFYILISKKDQIFYQELPNKIFETIILFTGNLDYMDTPWRSDSNNSSNSTSENELFHDFPNKEVFTKFVFIIFVLFLAIILQNLLLGLLVIDTENLQKKVELSKQTKRVSFVIRLEQYLNHSYLDLVSKLLNYKKMKVENKMLVTDADRWILKEEEKQHLEFILSRKVKRPNLLKKMRDYIVAKINERH